MWPKQQTTYFKEKQFAVCTARRWNQCM